MKILPRNLAALSLLTASLVGSVHAEEHEPFDEAINNNVEATAFINASLITMKEDGLLENHTVLVQGGVITKIGPENDVQIPNGTRIIDCEGQFLMPGLTDMHVHIAGDIFEGPLQDVTKEDFQNNIHRQLTNYVAHGVTTVRNMSDPTTVRENNVLQLKAEVANGDVFGPTIYTAPNVIDGYPPSFPTSATFESPEDAAAYVEKSSEKGYDLIKVYQDLPRDQFDAVMDKANELGIPVGGHWVQTINDFEYGLKKGWKSIEHLSGFDLTLNEGPLSDVSFYNHGAGWEYATEEKIIALAEMAAKYDIFVVPNLTMKNLAVPAYEASIEAPNELSRYQSEQFKKLENFEWWPAEFRATHTQTEPARMALVKALHDRGVTILAGTDTGVPGVYVGEALFEEMELLADSGLSNFEVLKTATINAAQFFPKGDKFGSIQKNYRADLLLLKNNPLENISHIREQSGVMLRGEWIQTPVLQKRVDALYPE